LEKGIYNQILSKKRLHQKMLAVLIDPDKAEESSLKSICSMANELPANFILIGGSLLTDGDLEQTISIVKTNTNLPIILFPGSSSQISNQADGILFLSLLSSRNPEMLIGQQVVAAPYLKKTSLEVISTAYLLVDSGIQTTASYMSNSNPIPANKTEIAASTALAGEYLGMNLIYMDGGSGALNPISAEMIKKTRSYTSIPIIIGGGLNSIEKVKTAYESGADMVVIGNALESKPNFLKELIPLLQSFNN